jgi:hypothetical protein
MSKLTMTLVAVLLAGSIGAASGRAQTQPQTGAAMTPPYREQVPATKPLQSHVGQPRINPSAAGTLGKSDKDAARAKTGEDGGEHSGSVGSNANTHPLKALEAGGKPRQEGMTEPSGIYPPSHSTMNRDAGR